MHRWLLLVLIAGCAEAPAETGSELPLGDQLEDDFKADGQWGDALTCKPIPSFPALVAPRITLSIDGQTVHVVDTATGYDKVFPTGVGAIVTDETDSAYRESHSYEPIIFTGKSDFTLTVANIQPCKTWWTDPETGKKQPVFGGLPFMPFFGGYAMHGPIDNFRAPNGGTLRRGYVSHGCFRMQSADVLELYARIRTLRSVPVHLQREPERRADGRRVDVSDKWIGAECAVDSDCNYTGGFCKLNRYSLRGFCSARCTTTCADRANLPTTFCVADPDDATRGMCVSKVGAVNFECRAGDHLVPALRTRFKQTVSATVCVPGTRGWVGDHCFASSECTNGTTCAGATPTTPGLCTIACTKYCSDLPGFTDTFCAAGTTGGSCARQCTPASNASECPGGTTCVERTRPGETTRRYVCQ
jgi:hypothetical protein